MIKYLEYICLKKIAFCLLAKIQTINPKIICCNSLRDIEGIIKSLLDQDSHGGLRGSFLLNSKEYCMAIELLIFEELIKNAPIFHKCVTVDKIENKIFHSNFARLDIFAEKIRKKRLISEINKHIITYDTFYLMNTDKKERVKDLLRFKLTDNNVEEIYSKCLIDHRLILKLIKIDIRALHYAMIIFNKDLF